jgi:predicted O-methyltransferase YrrM
MSLFLDYARSTDLYQELCRVAATGDGNLLERTDDLTAEAQAEFLRLGLQLASPKIIVETGTNKGMFGYLVSLICRRVVMHTLDVNPRAADAVAILNRKQANITFVFHEGDSRQTFPQLDITPDFAWIDGGHETDIVLSDLLQCYRLKTSYVAVDDTAYESVKNAVDNFIADTPYSLVPHPFCQYDKRRAVLLHLAR